MWVFFDHWFVEGAGYEDAEEEGSNIARIARLFVTKVE